jgi:hypothetical protein
VAGLGRVVMRTIMCTADEPWDGESETGTMVLHPDARRVDQAKGRRLAGTVRPLPPDDPRDPNHPSRAALWDAFAEAIGRMLARQDFARRQREPAKESRVERRCPNCGFEWLAKHRDG